MGVLLLLLAALSASGSQGGHLEKQGDPTTETKIQTWRCNCDTGATVAQDVEQVATYDCSVSE